MKSARRFVRLVLFWIGRVEMVIAAVVLIGIVGMIVAQVLLNAGLGNPITWEQEAGAYGLVWLTFIGASIGLKQMRHVTIVSFVGKLAPRPRYVVRAAVFACMLWALYILLRELLPIMMIESRSTTIALPIDLPRSYFFSVPLMASCILMTLTTLLFFLEAVLGVFKPDEQMDLISPVTERMG
ncbi:MAG: TRAP transporter small permease subunit [Hyphomicrobiales bacterium]|nr:TRAP transporter small permease subunit [Hyphomicrobiales bacterium]MCY4048971.1 TRAP transporter small permease subunit [Hyphomicrobiales bacterium]